MYSLGMNLNSSLYCYCDNFGIIMLFNSIQSKSKSFYIVYATFWSSITPTKLQGKNNFSKLNCHSDFPHRISSLINGLLVNDASHYSISHGAWTCVHSVNSPSLNHKAVMKNLHWSCYNINIQDWCMPYTDHKQTSKVLKLYLLNIQDEEQKEYYKKITILPFRGILAILNNHE